MWRVITRSNPQSRTAAIATTDLCAGALSWWNRTPFVSFPGRFDLIASHSWSSKLTYYSPLIVWPFWRYWINTLPFASLHGLSFGLWLKMVDSTLIWKTGWICFKECQVPNSYEILTNQIQNTPKWYALACLLKDKRLSQRMLHDIFVMLVWICCQLNVKKWRLWSRQIKMTNEQ